MEWAHFGLFKLGTFGARHSREDRTNHYTIGHTINLGYSLDLFSLFLVVFLIDAGCIYPENSLKEGISEMCKGGMQVRSDIGGHFVD